MEQELQEAFSLVDEACASLQVNRATNRAIEAALIKIHGALQNTLPTLNFDPQETGGIPAPTESE